MLYYYPLSVIRSDPLGIDVTHQFDILKRISPAMAPNPKALRATPIVEELSYRDDIAI